VYRELNGDLSQACRYRLDTLLTSKISSGVSHLSWIRPFPHAASARNPIDLTERVRALYRIDVGHDRVLRVSHRRRLQLAREGQRASAQQLLELEPMRRHATLVATVVDLSETLMDAAIQMFERLIAPLFKKAEHRESEDLHRDARALYGKVVHFAAIGRQLIEARSSGTDPIQAIEQVVSWERFEVSVEDAEALTQRESTDVIGRLGIQYATLRRYAPAFIGTFNFKGIPAVEDLIRAVNMLDEMNVLRQRKLPANVPTSFVPPRWRPYVFQDGEIDRRYYEICVLSELRDRLRAGDVWVPDSRQYRKLEDHLVTSETFDG